MCGRVLKVKLKKLWKPLKKLWKRPQHLLLPLALVGGVVWAVWAYPALIDAVRYGDLPQGCWDGAFRYSGDVDGAHVGGRHCAAGATYSGTEAGYLLHFEFAREGRLLLYGRRDLQADKGRASALQLALLRTPGEDGEWLCASGGEYTSEPDNFMRGEARLTGVRRLKPATAQPDGALHTVPVVVDALGLGTPIQGQVHDQTLAGGRTWGFSCDPDTTRCDLSLGHEQALWRLFARSKEPMRSPHGMSPTPLAAAFLAIEDARAPSRVVIAEARGPSSLRLDADQRGDLSHLSLEGLRALTPCPSPDNHEGAPPSGALTVSWSR